MGLNIFLPYPFLTNKDVKTGHNSSKTASRQRNVRQRNHPKCPQLNQSPGGISAISGGSKPMETERNNSSRLKVKGRYPILQFCHSSRFLAITQLIQKNTSHAPFPNTNAQSISSFVIRNSSFLPTHPWHKNQSTISTGSTTYAPPPHPPLHHP